MNLTMVQLLLLLLLHVLILQTQMSCLLLDSWLRNAVERGLSVKPYIKTSLSPGSGVVTEYFEKAGV